MEDWQRSDSRGYLAHALLDLMLSRIGTNDPEDIGLMREGENAGYIAALMVTGRARKRAPRASQEGGGA